MEIGYHAVYHLKAITRVIKISVSPCPAVGVPERAADSNARIDVVPIAHTRLPRALAATILAAVSAGTSYHSLCILCSAMIPRTGWRCLRPHVG